jgi:hydrogenase maturation protein HypF
MKQDPVQLKRLKVAIRGAVQGVGFRPFVYRLANQMCLKGWVNNSSQGVFIEVEGKQDDLEKFLSRLKNDKPPHSFIQSLESAYLDPLGFELFEVRPSDETGSKTALIMPDIATCLDCLQEIFDPANRRFRYPFTNCTNCGPRYTIINDLPYDRAYTTMKNFIMCKNCQAEYDNPADRRFHAQPNACPACGPQLALWDKAGKVIDTKSEALSLACAAIRKGQIVAIKGIGGFHLAVDSRNDSAVERLRQLKGREEKPLALMYPSLEMVKDNCEVSEIEEQLLISPESPIVLLRKRDSQKTSSPRISNLVAPENPSLGVMLPYAPLHHLLLSELGFPIVATSGNRSDEPICIDEYEAPERLSMIADLFLVHNRPIARHVDDSIVRIMAGRELVMRRARGYAPLPIFLKAEAPRILAVGAHLKNTVAISIGNQVITSQHIGDLESSQAYAAFENVIKGFSRLYDFSPDFVASDLHPDYLSTRYAEKSGLEVHHVQHHYAHIKSCMAENELEGPLLGVSWDGTGFGTDKTIWGGEFLRIENDTFKRVGHFRTFRLPGGETAISEPCRAALGLLYEIYGEKLFSMNKLPPVMAFSSGKLEIIRKMITAQINAPVTSSAGRLFDAISSIIGIRQQTRYEGQAAMELEFALHGIETSESYPFDIIIDNETAVIDWEQMIRLIINDFEGDLSAGMISAKFHNTLTEIIVDIAKREKEKRVALSGGCFQNRYLTERTIERLTAEGFQPYWHQRIPPNDGGIALGQIAALSHFVNKE